MHQSSRVQGSTEIAIISTSAGVHKGISAQAHTPKPNSNKHYICVSSTEVTGSSEWAGMCQRYTCNGQIMEILYCSWEIENHFTAGFDFCIGYCMNICCFN